MNNGLESYHSKKPTGKGHDASKSQNSHDEQRPCTSDSIFAPLLGFFEKVPVAFAFNGQGSLTGDFSFSLLNMFTALLVCHFLQRSNC